MRLAAFDLEIAKVVDDSEDWLSQRPLGISCAEIKTNDGLEMVWDGRHYGGGKLPEKACQQMVGSMYGLMGDGVTFVTVNGLHFDFNILAEESELPSICSVLALGHIDLCFIVFCLKGYPLGLDAMALGMTGQGKLHDVTLSDGTPIDDMDGARAPELWQAGEYDAVRAYLHGDVVATLQTAEAIARERVVRWTSRRGNEMDVGVEKLFTVRECLELPLPDTSWMEREPLKREEFMAWMEENGE